MFRVIKYIDKNLERIPLIIIVASMSFLIVLQVFMRYVMQSSLDWSEELVRWLFVWFIWLGTSYAIHENKHVAVTVFIKNFPDKTKYIISIIGNIVMLIFFLRLVYLGWEQINNPFIARQKSIVLYWFFSDTKVTLYWLYASLPFGALLSAYRLIQNLWKQLSNGMSSSVKQDNILEDEVL